jgi:hypothetical protein
MSRSMFIFTIIFGSVFVVGGSWVGYIFLRDVFDGTLPTVVRIVAAGVTAVFGFTVYVGISTMVKLIKSRNSK